MASALRPPRVPKPKCALPSHYYESFLEKKGPCDQDYKKFWAGLQGLTLYFYNSNRDFQYMEKLDLGTFVKLTDEAPWGTSHDPGTHFNLVLRKQEIKFKVESLESREMWKGFILTVVELRVPSNLTLLPGHLYMMAEVLAKEEVRRSLEIPSAPVVRHYKVKREGTKYVIDVEEPVSCASLDAVVNYFVLHTKKALVPFLLDEDYEKVLGYVEADKENGESLWVAPSVPAVPGPGPASPTSDPKQPSPTSITPGSSQDKLPPLSNPDENYVIPIEDATAADYVNGDVLSTGRLMVLKPKKCPPAPKVQAKPPKPPTVPKPEPKGLPGCLARKLAVSSAQAFFPTTALANVTTELEEKLQRRRALEHTAGLAGDQRANLRAWHISQANPSSQN
ncbi:signal-transducing adaptor protein 2 isoform X3 [Rhinolophus ferrumequinum]|uniref:signal-transducing adaptor protein 2 isoform X3 n=1 Tax=Rhinolophus ferrumequinum TaxID=59479 RepID=UPI00140FC4B0|nr:signal-transducing adaptor protein 2 isoform X3 [Rhinolophus ferrumequinum]